MKQYLRIFTALFVLMSVSACVYRIDVPQGNFLEQRKIDKLRVDMNTEQVLFVLGTPVVQNMFNTETWVYLYYVRQGNGGLIRRELRLEFVDEKLKDMTGDFEKPKDFDIPLGS